MKEIRLTQNKIALVDDDDYEELNQFKWYAAKMNNDKFYAVRKIKNNNGIWKDTVRMHREILHTPKHLEVDHIDGNTLNNCKSNVRFCTTQQNNQNRIVNQNKNLKVKGVSYYGKIKKFRSRIMLNGKAIHLGLFTTAQDAVIAYRKAEKEYFGKFARNEDVLKTEKIF